MSEVEGNVTKELVMKVIGSPYNIQLMMQTHLSLTKTLIHFVRLSGSLRCCILCNFCDLFHIVLS